MNPVLQQVAAAARRSPLVTINIAVLLILGIAAYFLREQQQTLTQQYTEMRRNGEAMDRALKSQPSTSAELVKIQDALKVIDGNLVIEADLAENLGYFYQLETVSRVRLSQLNQLSSQPPLEGNPYKSIPYSLRATGSYAQLMSFLREMETGPRLLRIRSYSFGRGDAATNAMLLDLTVELLGSP